MKRKEQLSGKNLQSLSDATAETHRMASLVDNLLLLSELDADCRRWTLQIDDLRIYVDQWVAKLNPESRECLQTIVANENDEYQVQLDQDAFYLILDNLLDNSRRFCRSRLLIQIRLIKNPSHVELQFIDNGPGMQNDENYDAAFEWFARIEEHRKADMTDGGGLGLPLVKSLMEGMGGSASCSSPQSPDNSGCHGLVVTLRFPRTRLSAGVTNSA
jgi:signal transduction histidine kinase